MIRLGSGGLSGSAALIRLIQSSGYTTATTFTIVARGKFNAGVSTLEGFWCFQDTGATGGGRMGGMSFVSGSPNRIRLWLDSGINTNYYTITNYSVVIGTEFTIACTFKMRDDSFVPVVYINGTLATVSKTGTFSGSAATIGYLSVGWYQGGGGTNACDSDMNYVFVFDKALADEQLKELSLGNIHGWQLGAVAWYVFDKPASNKAEGGLAGDIPTGAYSSYYVQGNSVSYLR